MGVAVEGAVVVVGAGVGVDVVAVAAVDAVVGAAAAVDAVPVRAVAEVTAVVASGWNGVSVKTAGQARSYRQHPHPRPRPHHRHHRHRRHRCSGSVGALMILFSCSIMSACSSCRFHLG